MKKEIVFAFYVILIIILTIIGYILSKSHRLEYALLGSLIGVLLSLFLWVTWGYKNVDI